MAFTEVQIQQVWEQGLILKLNNPQEFRKDIFGAWISRDDYGIRALEDGWEIDYIIPISEGGTNDISNLRPLQWENYVAKANGQLDYVVTAEGTENIKKRSYAKV